MFKRNGKSDFTFGEIKKDLLEMTIYEKDSSASAVILHDHGKIYFELTETGNFIICRERELLDIKYLIKMDLTMQILKFLYYFSAN
jgi:hypothetical protein